MLGIVIMVFGRDLISHVGTIPRESNIPYGRDIPSIIFGTPTSSKACSLMKGYLGYLCPTEA